MKNVILFLLAALLLTSCADAVNVTECVKDTHVYGFWAGTWHGLIVFWSFIGSLFNDDIALYAVNNNGAWYNFGFVGGLFIVVRVFFWLLKLLFIVFFK